MTNTDLFIKIFQLAREAGNAEIAKLAISKIAEEYGIIPPVLYSSIQEIPIYTALHRSNRITAIKELREKAMLSGLAYGLKEAKDEIDRRIAEAEERKTESYW